MAEKEKKEPNTHAAHAFARLLATMRRLRAPGGCPWDAEQTHDSLKTYLIEEAHEAVDAIDRGDDDDLCDELGDVLLQVVFHCEIAAERGAFTIADVVENLTEKLIRRHPHVFGEASVRDSAEVVRNWARIKHAERAERGGQSGSSLDGVPRTLPALLRAHRLGQRAATIGLDWADASAVIAKLREELGELERALDHRNIGSAQRELADLLFAAVSFARKLGAQAESLLHTTLDRFERRVRALEALARSEGISLPDLDAGEIDALWNRVKTRSEED